MAKICGVVGSDGVGGGFFILSLSVEGGINIYHLTGAVPAQTANTTT